MKGILSKTAEEQGYYKWDGVTLSDYIKKKYDIDLKVRQCQRLFHELGFSRIRPRIIPSESEQNEEAREEYIKALEEVHNAYAKVYEMSGDKDASGYALPQSLRKCLVIHGNFPAWQYMLSLRSCNRNTKEVQHICELIIQAINDECGKVWADQCLPACTKGKCPEGKFSCGHPYEDKRIQPVDKLLDEDEDEEKEK